VLGFHLQSLVPEHTATRASLSRKRRFAITHISHREATDLLSKFLSEGTPLIAFFRTPFGAEARIPGLLDRLTPKDGVVISVSGPPMDVERGYICVPPFDERCDFWYGEKRELSEQFRRFGDVDSESTLIITFPNQEVLALFFTL
jgi:hypothetical protein